MYTLIDHSTHVLLLTIFRHFRHILLFSCMCKQLANIQNKMQAPFLYQFHGVVQWQYKCRAYHIVKTVLCKIYPQFQSHFSRILSFIQPIMHCLNWIKVFVDIAFYMSLHIKKKYAIRTVRQGTGFGFLD